MNAVTNFTQNPDPWEERAWNVLAVEPKLSALLGAGSKPPQFRLQRRSGAGPVAYTVAPATDTGGLPECLQPGVVLTQKGSKLLETQAFKALGEPETSPHTDFWDVSKSVIRAVEADKDSLRLEGEFKIDGKAHTLCLYHVQKLVAGSRSFLVLDVKEDDPKSNPDGTAIGNN
jgi:hypothetical protein